MAVNWEMVMGVSAILISFMGTFLTLAIALGFNRHMGRWVSRQLGGFYKPDYGQIDDGSDTNQ